MNLLLKIISQVRQEKSKFKKSVKAEIILTLKPAEYKKLRPFLNDLKAICNAKEIKQGEFKINVL